MTSVKLLLYKSKAHKKGTYPLVFQVIHERRKKVYYTSFSVLEDDFDPVKEKVHVGGRSGLTEKEIKNVNRKLSEKRKIIWDKIEYLRLSKGDFSVSDMNDKNLRQQDIYLLKGFSELYQRKLSSKNDGMAAAYKSTASSIERFLKGRDVPLSVIDHLFVKDYENYLLEQVSGNTIAYYMRNFRTAYNSLAEDGYRTAEEYPFKHVRMSAFKTQKRALDRTGLSQLAALTFNSGESNLELARDLFLFSFYTRGMSLVDIVYLKKDDITMDGAIIYTRRKSKQTLRIKITPPLLKLIDKYANDSPYVLSILDEVSSLSLYEQYRRALARTNHNLKIIGKRLKFSSKLTSYVARHSWATLAKTLGASTSVISEGLGHTSEIITQIYLKEFDTIIIDKVNEEVIGLI